MGAEALRAILRAEIARDGPIGLDRYMALALAHPRHGYYVTRDPLGRAGDFTTAPEISQMFGELIGLWCAERWAAMGSPAPVHLVELGPGRGTLMADALRAAARAMPAFRAASRLHLVEASPVLRRAQATALAEAAPAWHDGIETLPPGPLLLVANEFFDALPIRQWRRRGDGWAERQIGWDEVADGPIWVEMPAATGPETGYPVPDDAIVETAPASLAIVAALAARLVEDGGAALIVDYGPQRSGPGDSFQAVRRHRPVDPLAEPGAADLTAHVDFAALARAARQSGAAAFGPVPQAEFLRALGLAARAAALARHRPERMGEIAAEVERLCAPDAMGTLFKALALQAPSLPPPPGFPGPPS